MTQNEMILDHIKTYGSITPMDAMSEYGCMRLAARIADLKKEGHLIKKERETKKNRFGKKVSFARYYLGDKK